MRTALAAALLLAGAAAARAEPVGRTGWDVRVQPGSFDSPPCVARIAGPDLSTSLIQNRDGRPLLVLARPEWRNPPGEARIAFSIDGEPAMQVRGAAMVNLYLSGVLAPEVFERLQTARSVEWILPNGRFHGRVEGLREAWTALTACNAAAAAPLKGPTPA